MISRWDEFFTISMRSPRLLLCFWLFIANSSYLKWKLENSWFSVIIWQVAIFVLNFIFNSFCCFRINFHVCHCHSGVGTGFDRLSTRMIDFLWVFFRKQKKSLTTTNMTDGNCWMSPKYSIYACCSCFQIIETIPKSINIYKHQTSWLSCIDDNWNHRQW